MPIFTYKAKKKSAEPVEGKISAQTQEEAVEIINRMGLFPVSVVEHTHSGQPSEGSKAGKIRSKEIYIFSRQLSNLLKAGVPILRALDIITDQTQNGKLKNVLATLHKEIKDGHSFSEGLTRYPHLFSPLYIAMVTAGEEGGNLNEMLTRMAEYLRVQEEISSKIRTALTYPAFMSVVGLGTVIFMLTYVMPQMTALFDTLDQALPLPTQILLDISAGLKKWWFVVVILLGALFITGMRWVKSKSGRLAVSQLQLSFPLVRDFIFKVELGRFCRTLGMLLKSGVSLIQGIQIAIPTLGNELIKEDLSKCRSDLEGGATLGDSLKKLSQIPLIVTNLIAVGEETGSLTGTLQDIADSYEQESEETLKAVMSLLEPVMILAVGLIVGFIVIAMLLPVFQMDILAR